MPTLVLDADYAATLAATADDWDCRTSTCERRIPRLPICPGRGGKHISAIDWAGVAQRMADALPPDHPARAEFDGLYDMYEIIDLGNGGSVTVLAGPWARLNG